MPPVSSKKVQCLGLKKNGQRCAIWLITGEDYCRYHYKQEREITPDSKTLENVRIISNETQTSFSLTSQGILNSVLPNSLKKTPFIHHNLKSGFIYIYTLRHLIDHKAQKQDWLQLKSKDSKKWKVFDPKGKILIKIGMTSKTVRQRLKEWESQCHHELESINPYSLEDRKFFGLIKRPSFHSERGLRYYDRQGCGFYTERELAAIERQIHDEIRTLYGQGDVICHGCKPSEQGGGIHKEWFLVPRDGLVNVFKIIDRVVGTYN